MQYPSPRPPPVSSHELVVLFQRAGFVVTGTRADCLVLQRRDSVVLVPRGRVLRLEDTARLLEAAKMETHEFLRRLKSYRRDACAAAVE